MRQAPHRALVLTFVVLLPAPLRLQGQGAGARCSLSPGKQLAAVDLFSKMMPVFRHPRCFNCHGGFDIASDEHEGSDAVRQSGLDPRALLTVPERQRLHAACGSCHDHVRGQAVRFNNTVEGWMVAPPPMLWDGKSDEQLCLKMKQFENDGAQFIDHVESDHKEIQFVEAAFNGDRGLGDALGSYGLTIEKPPGSQADLIAKARKWVNSLNGVWKDPPECGCVKPKIELTMKSEVTGTANGGMMGGQFSATVPLKPDSARAFRGEGPIRYGSYRTPPIPPRCRSTFRPGSGTVTVKEVRFTADEDGDPKISLALTAADVPAQLTMSCPGMPSTLTIPLPPWAQEWKYTHEQDRKNLEYVFQDFEVPANAATSGGRTLFARKELTRTVQRGGVDVTSKTTFELWAEQP